MAPTAAKTTTIIPPILSRRRTKPAGGEEAFGTVNLGEFNDDATLSVSEANALLAKVLEKRKEDPSVPAPPNTDSFIKTRAYLQTTSRIKDRSAVEQAANMSSGLVKSGIISAYERAQLATLCCDNLDEARTLIPSLEGKISDNDLQQVINDISKLKDFT